MTKKQKKTKTKNPSQRKPWCLLLRYLVLLALMFALPLIYKILTPITIYLTANLLKIFYQVSVFEQIIIINLKTAIQIIPSCIAGSAYLLLLILNLSISMKFKKRFYSILFSVILLFVLNIFRIFFLSILLVNDFQFFDFTHKLFWYALSTIFVVGIWLLTIKIFSIKEIPVYSDVKYLIKNIKKRKS